MIKVFYKKRAERGAMKKLMLDKDSYPAHYVSEKIRFIECIEKNMSVIIFDNKTQ